MVEDESNKRNPESQELNNSTIESTTASQHDSSESQEQNNLSIESTTASQQNPTVDAVHATESTLPSSFYCYFILDIKVIYHYWLFIGVQKAVYIAIIAHLFGSGKLVAQQTSKHHI